jgi:hypothetical protein
VGTPEAFHQQLFVAAPYAALAAELERADELRQQMIQESESTIDGEPQPLRDRVVALQDNFDKRWSQTLAIDSLVSCKVACAQVTIDRQAMTMSIKQAPVISTDPGDYPDHAMRTSEILSMVAARLTSIIQPVNIDWVASNYALLKVIIYTIDFKSINFDNFRINIDDEEEWDFAYPQLDDAISRKSTE